MLHEVNQSYRLAASDFDPIKKMHRHLLWALVSASVTLLASIATTIASFQPQTVIFP